jgi:MoaA/NifB/PqqE/SkfB family radical SAM enzyme
MLISYDIHKEITQKFKDKKIKHKILANPLSLNQKNIKIFDLYDHVGISINSKNELKKLISLNLNKKNITIISNFNVINLYDYDDIESFVKEKGFYWMIQFTVYKHEDDLAIYNNENSLKTLQEKIQKSVDNDVKILLSDNISNSECGMGKSILGILYNGDVIPCLSMRTWVENITNEIEGNILKTSLKEMWENKFANYRFIDFKCCKDKCKNKKIFINKNWTLLIDKITINKENYDKIEKPKPYFPDITPPTIMMYGVV